MSARRAEPAKLYHGRTAQAWLASLAASLDDVPVEMVGRFGRPAAELSIESEAFAADLIVLAAPLRSPLWERLRAWRLRRAALGSKVPLILLPLPAAGADPRPGGTVAVPALR